MNKQEVIKIKKINTIMPEIFGIKRDEVIDIVNQLDEPEKPIVPQFVADWLEVCKDNLALSLASSMNPIVLRTNNQSEKTIHWFKSAKNQETFAKAWVFGYEVEKEKLYTVELPDPNSFGYTILRKNTKGKISITYTQQETWGDDESTQLTEAEIKKDFDWAWQFAKEVEE